MTVPWAVAKCCWALPIANEIAPFRAICMRARNGAVSDIGPIYSDPRNASKFAESVEFSAS